MKRQMSMFEYIGVSREQVREARLVFVYLDGDKVSVNRDDVKSSGYGYYLFLGGTHWVSSDGIYFFRKA